MPNQQTTAYIRSYIENSIQDAVRDGVLDLVVRILTFVLEWTVTFALGYEVQKITSAENRDIWTFVEFFSVFTVCVCIWIIKCCCVNEFCINCCLKCMKKNRPAPTVEPEPEPEQGERVGIMKSILGKMHMVLNRLAIGAIGFEVKKQLSKLQPLTTWDYVEISLIALFCIWILSIKYCILKCYLLKYCCPCCFKKQVEAERIEIAALQTQGEAANTQNGNSVQVA